MFNKMFDLNRVEKLDAAERALEYMNFRAITGEDESEKDKFAFEDEDYDGEDDF